MSRFSAVTYSPAEQTATIGADLIWGDVYAALEPYSVNVVGGRVSGVGLPRAYLRRRNGNDAPRIVVVPTVTASNKMEHEARQIASHFLALLVEIV